MLSILLGAILLLTGTILGWVAVVRIRRSEGQLYGLRLALFAGLLLPLILLDLLIFVGLVLLARAFAGAMDWAELLILAIVVCPLVDYWIVRKVWRLLTGSPDKSDSPSTSEPDKPGTFATLAIGFGFLSGLIPTLFYWLRPLHGDWLTDSTVEFMLWLTLAAALLAVALGWWTRASRRGRNGLIVGGISLTIWVLFFVAGQVSERGTTRAVTTLTENEAQATVELVENETRF
ncbi:MAG TPA: hypothetical protein VJ952_02040, partial [Opitutales bacterium]|nr:hypothetical protein [Opitutales bacterium]